MLSRKSLLQLDTAKFIAVLFTKLKESIWHYDLYQYIKLNKVANYDWLFVS